MAGVRPVANRTSSAVTVPPPSRVSVTGPSRRTPVTDVPKRRSTPAARRPSATNSPANGSTRGSRRDPRTSCTTSLPRARQAVAISQATTPPPTTASRGGTRSEEVASRLVHGRTSSRPGRPGRAARVPVHTATAWRAVRTRRPPSGVCTATRFGPSSRPWPRTRTSPDPFSHSTWPSSFQCEVNSSRRLRTASASSGPVTASRAPASRPASASAAAGRSSALLGMQAQYEHSPPTSSLSTTATLSPPACARSARFSPVGPAPTTTTSNSSMPPALPVGRGPVDSDPPGHRGVRRAPPPPSMIANRGGPVLPRPRRSATSVVAAARQGSP